MFEVIRTTSVCGEMAIEKKRIAELELVLTGTLHAFSRSPVPVRTRDFPEAYREAMSALSLANIPHILGWVMAYGCYARARFTDNINILALPAYRTDIAKAFIDLGFRATGNTGTQLSYEDVASGVEIRIEFHDDEPILAALQDPVFVEIFGINTPVIQPEYLMWMLCTSDQLKHHATNPTHK